MVWDTPGYQCPRSPQLVHLEIACSLAIGIFDLRSWPEVSSVIVKRSEICRSLRCSRCWSQFVGHVLDCAPYSPQAPSSFRTSLSKLADTSFVRLTDRRDGQLSVWRPRHGHSCEVQFSQSVCHGLGAEKIRR